MSHRNLKRPPGSFLDDDDDDDDDQFLPQPQQKMIKGVDDAGVSTIKQRAGDYENDEKDENEEMDLVSEYEDEAGGTEDDEDYADLMVLDDMVLDDGDDAVKGKEEKGTKGKKTGKVKEGKGKFYEGSSQYKFLCEDDGNEKHYQVGV